MYIDISHIKRNNKTYKRVLLRNSYRVKGKVKHDTIANLSSCSQSEIDAIKLALKHKDNLSELSHLKDTMHTKQGLGVGAVWVLAKLAERVGLKQILGNTQRGKLALWLVMARIIEQGSRLSATRLAQRHHVCDILKLKSFDENDLYDAMDFLASNQEEIEKELFNFRYKGKPPNFYLYDVTSSYFEGEQNEFACYGYNRDKKEGKKQVVIGLMTDDVGLPIAIEVFAGNTQDQKTVFHQIQKMAERFGVQRVTLVGDRGMLKQAQIEALGAQGFHYITAITKPQIETLVKNDIVQLSLFDEQIAEVVDENTRYVLRKNPYRAKEIEGTRQSKLAGLRRLIAEKNKYLDEHRKAKLETALRAVHAKAKQLKLDTWINVKPNERLILVEINEQAKQDISKFDGCYAIKTDLSPEYVKAQEIHDRYKELAYVERAFRSMKSVLLEMRAIYVRKEPRTQAHVFVIMLAYLLVYHLQKAWREVELTVEEGIAELASICSLEIQLPGQTVWQTIPEPKSIGRTLLSKLDISLPKAIPYRNATVSTTKKLVSERI
jgi:transposase